jgi:hypothetical protein
MRGKRGKGKGSIAGTRARSSAGRACRRCGKEVASPQQQRRALMVRPSRCQPASAIDCPPHQLTARLAD